MHDKTRRKKYLFKADGAQIALDFFGDNLNDTYNSVSP